jgi:chemotaxis protein CheD
MQTDDMRKQITIHIGEYCASLEPAVIKTLLGSCVAVCLFDPIRNVGGMNHIYLPGRADLNRFDAPARYGINAMELLINRMLSLGADRYCLTAKAFGGAQVFSGISAENSPGPKITEFVWTFLEKERIPLISYDLGGANGRQVYFHTDTGDAFVRNIQKIQMEHFDFHEKKAIGRVRKSIQASGKITLFEGGRNSG